MIIKKNRKFFYYLLLLLPIFQPKLFTHYNSTKILYIFFNSVEFIFFFLKYKKIDYTIVMWFLFRIYLLLLIIINCDYNSLLQWGSITIIVTNLIFIFKMANKKDELNFLLKGMLCISIIFLLINFITLLLFPRGIITVNFWNSTDNDIYFLGIKTQIPLIMFPAIISAIVLYRQSKSNFKYFALTIILCLVNIFYKNITTPIIGFIIGGILYILPKKIKSQFTLNRVFFISIVLQCLVIFFNIQNIFANILTDVFHKDVTMSSRIFIWNSAISCIKNMSLFQIVFGTGSSLPFVLYGKSYINPHSQLLQFIYTNGIIGNILMLLFFYSLNKKNKYNNNYFILSICFIELTLCTVEAYFDNAICFIPFLLLTCNSNYRKGCDFSE